MVSDTPPRVGLLMLVSRSSVIERATVADYLNYKADEYATLSAEWSILRRLADCIAAGDHVKTPVLQQMERDINEFAEANLR